MRPLKLTMTAFGPYAGEEVIDFTILGGRNIFLITGPTGAGKTTVFDGISYAVFGNASSSDRDGENLRSHFAKDDQLTSVELEFELRGRKYCIKRTPKQNKKKARGDGFTEQKADAELKIYSQDSPDEADVVSGISKVNEKIGEILGINYDQFRQIMMIPQGEFRKLITEDSTEREKILQRIFGTEGFKRVQDKLWDLERALRQKSTSLEERMGENIRGVDPGENEELRLLLENGSKDAIQKGIAQSIEEDTLRENELASNIEKIQDELVKKNSEIALAEENNRKFQNRDAAAKRKAELEARQEEYELKGRNLNNARKTLPLAAIEENRDAKELSLKTKKAEAEAAGIAAEKAKKAAELSQAEQIRQKLREPGRTALQQNIGRLESLRVKVTALDEMNGSAKALEEEEKGLEGKVKSLKGSILGNKEEALKLTAVLKLSREAKDRYFETAAKLEKMDKAAKGLQAVFDANGKLTDIRTRFISEKDEVVRAKQYLEQTMSEAARLQDLFLRGQAGFLAGTLQDSEPCPVCGSRNHPAPAVKMSGVPDKESLDAANDRNIKAQEDYNSKNQKYSNSLGEGKAQKEIVDKLKEGLGDKYRTEAEGLEKEALTGYAKAQIDALQTETEILRIELGKTEKLKEKESLLAADLETKTLEIEKAQKEAEEKSAALGDVKSKLASAWSLLDSVRAELPAGVDSLVSLEKLIKADQAEAEAIRAAIEEAEKKSKEAHIEQGKALTALKGAADNLSAAEAELMKAEERFREELKAADFGNTAEYRESKLDRQQMAELEADIKEYSGSRTAAAESLIKAEQEIEGRTVADVEELNEQLKAVNESKQSRSSEKEMLHARIVLNRTQLSSIVKSMKELEAVEEEYKVTGKLAKIARGDNIEKITFERYVLAAFFDDIIHAANMRLTRMTGSRYEMCRKTDRSKGNAQSGLEIEVLDNYTGRTRHIKTLSGGESFKASLSLALGLADVVQSYAGGISLDTMFVDEGFGTLDPESLDAAIQSLVELQDTGRLVGIISHVPELKERIDARLEITPGKEGSRAAFNV
jgi:DNA repair protein SbcC/Rad50